MIRRFWFAFLLVIFLLIRCFVVMQIRLKLKSMIYLFPELFEVRTSSSNNSGTTFCHNSLQSSLRLIYCAIHNCVPNSWYISLCYLSCERGQGYRFEWHGITKCITLNTKLRCFRMTWRWCLRSRVPGTFKTPPPSSSTASTSPDTG